MHSLADLMAAYDGPTCPTEKGTQQMGRWEQQVLAAPTQAEKERVLSRALASVERSQIRRQLAAAGVDDDEADAAAEAFAAAKLHGFPDNLTQFITALDQAAAVRGMDMCVLAKLIAADGNETQAFVDWAAAQPAPASPYTQPAAGAPYGDVEMILGRGKPRGGRFSAGLKAELRKLGRSDAEIARFELDQRPLGERWAAARRLAAQNRAYKLGIPPRDGNLAPSRGGVMDTSDPHNPRSLGGSSQAVRAYHLTSETLPVSGRATPPSPYPDASQVAPRAVPGTAGASGLVTEVLELLRSGRYGYTGSNEQFLNTCAAYGRRFTPAWDTNRVLASILENPGVMYRSIMDFAGNQAQASGDFAQLSRSAAAGDIDIGSYWHAKQRARVRGF